MTKKRAAKAPSKAKAASKKSAEGEAQAELTPEAMEGLLRDFAAMMGLGELDAEDVKALATSLDALPPQDDLSLRDAEVKFQAQELAWTAMEARSEAQARKLVKRALKLDPDCVDALVELVKLDAVTQKQRVEGMQTAVDAGERALGAKFFQEHEGNFWLQIETRPYMRAMEALAGELVVAGLQQDGVRVYERMLLLNPNDNQGVRYPLLGQYLAMDDVAGANRLLRRYKNERSAPFTWGTVLARFIDDDIEGAEAALREAIKTNRFVALQLAGLAPPPKTLPDMYAPGSAEEAALCHHYLEAAWVTHKEASFWVYDQLTQLGMAPPRTKPSWTRQKP